MLSSYSNILRYHQGQPAGAHRQQEGRQKAPANATVSQANTMRSHHTQQVQVHLSRSVPFPRALCRWRCTRTVAVAAVPPLTRLNHGGDSSAAVTAEQQLHLQLRSLPTISTDGLTTAATLAAQAAAAQAQQQLNQHQQDQEQQQQQHQASGPLAALLVRLPKFDGRLKGLLLLNVMTLLMGSNWVVVKASADAATMTDSMTFMAMRFAMASALFLPFLKLDKKVAKAGIEIGFWYAAGYVAQALALASTSASRASLLSTFTVLTVPLIAGLSGQKIKPIVWACSAAALAGTAMLEEGSSLGPPNVGDAWAVASALFFGAQMFVAERHMRALPPKSELPLMGVSMLTVATLAAGAAAAAHSGDLAHVADGLQRLVGAWQAALPAALGGGAAVPAAEAEEAARTLQQLFYTSVMSTDLVLFVELVALQLVTSTDAAMIYSLEPVVGALLAYALLGERWGTWGWVGGGTILAASMLTQVAGATQGEEAGAAAPAAGEDGAAGPSEAPEAACGKERTVVAAAAAPSRSA